MDAMKPYKRITSRSAGKILSKELRVVKGDREKDEDA